MSILKVKSLEVVRAVSLEEEEGIDQLMSKSSKGIIYFPRVVVGLRCSVLAPLAKLVHLRTSHSNGEDPHCLDPEQGFIMLCCKRFNICNRLSHGAMKN